MCAASLEQLAGAGDVERVRRRLWRGADNARARRTAWRLLARRVACAPQFDCTVDAETAQQIAIDCPRTCTDMPHFKSAAVQLRLKRVLTAWTAMHPVAGYVQGMNNIAAPLLIMFADDGDTDVLACMCALMHPINDHFTYGQPGLRRQLACMAVIVERVDARLHDHLQRLGIDYSMIAVAWLQCLLSRTVHQAMLLRVWDTFMAEGADYPMLHICLCVHLLVSRSERIVATNDMNSVLSTLAAIDAENWTAKDIDTAVSTAHVMRIRHQRATTPRQS